MDLSLSFFTLLADRHRAVVVVAVIRARHSSDDTMILLRRLICRQLSADQLQASNLVVCQTDDSH